MAPIGSSDLPCAEVAVAVATDVGLDVNDWGVRDDCPLEVDDDVGCTL